MKRLRSIDALRSTALLGMVLSHAAVYQYARIFEIDFDHPPLAIGLMGFFVLLGGSFIMMSGLVNTFAALGRLEEGTRPSRAAGGNLCLTGAVIVALGWLYGYFFGPATFDFEAGTQALTMINASIRAGAWVFPPATTLLDGSSISVIGWNLVLMGLLLAFLLRGGTERIERARASRYAFLGVLAAAVFSFAFFRYRFYPLAGRAITEGRWLRAVLLNLLLEKPYPLLPYFSFAVVGMIIGFAARERAPRRPLLVLLAVGIVVIVAGVLCMILMPANLAEVTGSWFSRVVLELGFFMTLGCAALLAGDFRPGRKEPNRQRFFGTIGRASLTIYFLQPALTELLARATSALFPGWNDRIGTTLIFAAGNVVLWVAILLAWRRASYRFSVDWAYGKLLGALGRASRRMEMDQG